MMTILKKSLIIFGLIYVFFATSYVFAQDAKPNYVFIQSADSAVLTVVDKTKGLYALTLKQSQPYIHYVSERPNSYTGVMPTQKFIQTWAKAGHNSFAQDAPNVTVEGIQVHSFIHEKPVMLILELAKPSYNEKTHEVTYQAKSLSDNEILPKEKSIKLKHTVLFIDSGWCPSCCCG
jgi:hypothetical protein